MVGNLGKVLAFFCYPLYEALLVVETCSKQTKLTLLSGQFPVLQRNGPMFGFLLAILVGTVIIGGIKSIAKVTEKIVPFMAGLYVLAASIIIVVNFGQIGAAFAMIIEELCATAFGGFIGVLIQGFRRAAFSNEAGVGSTSIAHSAAKTNQPVSEGIVSLLEPLVDTVIICTMTALVTSSQVFGVQGVEGAQLTSQAFGSVISWFHMY